MNHATEPTGFARRSALCCAAALAAFAGASRAVRELLPRPQESELALKLDRLEELAGEVDTVFIGSSVVQHHVDPELFDRATAEHGAVTHSFNLGARMMSTLETAHALREVLAVAPAGLRVFLECRHMGAIVDGEVDFTVRFVDWHDARATRAAVALVLESDRPAERKLELVRVHVEAFAKRFANVGLAPLALGPLLRPPEERSAARESVLGPGGDGFTALEWALERETRLRTEALARGEEPPPAELAERRAAFASLHESFAARVRELLLPPEPVQLGEAERAVYRDLVRTATAAGAEVVFFTSCDVVNPRQDVAGRGERLRALEREGVLPRLIDLALPREFPELFDPAHRFDWSHLDAEGARAFTRHLAELWVGGEQPGG